MTRARLYGLKVEADYDLHDIGEPFDGSPDVEVRSLPRFAEWTALDGEILLDFSTENDHWYVLVRGPSGRLTLRIPTLCDFVISADLAHVTVAMHADAPDGMDAVLTTGTLLSALLFLRGAPVLHGSAVEVEGAAIGFIGHSGQGKTTMATAFCAEGAASVTDDVLVIDAQAGRQPLVRRGSRELRLRDGTLELVGAGDADAATRTTVDARTVLTPRYTAHDLLPLRAIVIPRPRRDGSKLSFERMPTKEAVLALLAFPRLMGWRDPDVLGAYFSLATATAAAVPVVVANVPWGEPFPGGFTEALTDALT
jgi:hypothetical protein